MRKLRKKYPGAYTLEPLHDLADILHRTIGNKYMDMIDRYLTRYDVNLMFQSNLPQHITGPDRYGTSQYPLPILGKPDQMHFEVCSGMGTQLITSHSDRL